MLIILDIAIMVDLERLRIHQLRRLVCLSEVWKYSNQQQAESSLQNLPIDETVSVWLIEKMTDGITITVRMVNHRMMLTKFNKAKLLFKYMRGVRSKPHALSTYRSCLRLIQSEFVLSLQLSAMLSLSAVVSVTVVVVVAVNVEVLLWKLLLPVERSYPLCRNAIHITSWIFQKQVRLNDVHSL
jgi:hypothetical protein